jgi:4-hydroxy-tetrahydrodipicolinate reductase
MGRAIVRAAAETSGEVNITAAVASRTSPSLGADIGELAGVGRAGVAVTSDLAVALAGADVAIDFSNASATGENLAACLKARKPVLIGTTGYEAAVTAQFAAAAKHIPLLVASNTSVGVTLLAELARLAAEAMPSTFDVQILEAHHRMKKDAPSGTALTLGQAVETVRPGADVGYAVVRAGDIVGEHTVLFAGPGERLTLSHSATDRGIFARGAVRAAAWLASRPPGRYAMRDVVLSKSDT